MLPTISKIVLAVLFSGTCILSAWNVVKRFDQNDAYMEVVEIPSTSTLDGNLFNRLNGHSIWVSLTDSKLQISHTPCSPQVIVAPETGMLANGLPAGDAGKRFVAELCRSEQGQRLRARIIEFNRGFRLAGIRDNRLKEEAKANGGSLTCKNGSIARLYLPTGCRSQFWDAQLTADERPLSSVAQSTIPLNEYAFLASAQNGFFADWAVVSPQQFDPTKDEHLSFTTKLQGNANDIQIQTIGSVVGIEVGGTVLDVSDGRLGTQTITFGSSRLTISARSFCPNEGNGSGRAEPISCTPDTANGRPIGTMVSLSGQISDETTASIIVAPSIVIPKRLRQGNLDVASTTKLGSGALRMECSFSELPSAGVELRDEADTKCKLSWSVPEESEQASDDFIYYPFEQDGMLIVDDSGNLTQEAFEIGLAEVMGLGIHDVGSLAASLLGSEASRDFELSINPRMQQIAQRAVDRFNVCGGQGLNCDSRIDFVMMDAQKDTAGEVLVVVGSPRPSEGMSAWDIGALEFADGARSPMAAHAWRRHNNKGTPGSTFKLVTALAASQYALDEDDDILTQYLIGTPDLRNLLNDFQIVAANEFTEGPEKTCTPLRNFSATEAQALVVKGPNGGSTITRCVTDTDDKHPIGRIFQAGSVTNCHQSSQRRIGMCAALWKSSNIYFGGLALYLDQDKLLCPGTDRERDTAVGDLAMQNMTSKLFPSLADARQVETDVYPYDVFSPAHRTTFRVRTSAPSIGASASTAPKVDPDTPRDPNTCYVSPESRRLRLAQAGFGQTVNATPMTMAAVAASIATGTVVRPHGVPLTVRGASSDPLEGAPLLAAPSNKRAQADAMLDQIRLGMHAAVNRGGGTTTALASLSGLEVWGKSGTATIVNDPETTDRPYALWVVGYAKPTRSNALIDRPVAFACRRAQAAGSGGTVCGAIVKSILNDIMSAQ